MRGVEWRKLLEPSSARVVSAPAPIAPSAGVSQAVVAPAAPIATPAVQPTQAPFALTAPRLAASCTPLRPGRYKLELTAGQALHDKLEQLKDLLRHQVPDGDLATIVERAVDLLVDETLKRRFAQVRTPRKPRSNKLVRRRKLKSR